MKHQRSKKKESYIILGKNIRNIRKRNHLSQEDLAFKLDSARNYIGCIERGEKFPSFPFLMEIADALECKLSELVENI
jgi:transcriptional regulator with XRE-family HTH domain